MKSKIMLSLFLSVVVSLSSCIKEDEGDWNVSSQDESYVSNKNKNHSLSKRWLDNYESEVFVRCGPYRVNPVTRHRTIRLMNLDETIIQEWFLDNFHTSSTQGLFVADRDHDGVSTDYFYLWSQCEEDLLDTTKLNKVIYNSEGLNISGFHVPNITDVLRLSSLFSSCTSLLNMLNLDPTYKSGDYDIIHNVFLTPCMYIDYPNDAHPSCGTMVSWPKLACSTDSMYLILTNNEYERGMVRLVRDLTIDEWYED